jgi:hypothetical protein
VSFGESLDVEGQSQRQADCSIDYGKINGSGAIGWLVGHCKTMGQEHYSSKDGGTVDACQRVIKVDGNLCTGFRAECYNQDGHNGMEGRFCFDLEIEIHRRT